LFLLPVHSSASNFMDCGCIFPRYEKQSDGLVSVA
jgi:hypothetical protein